jgi:hypothetical protein
VQPGASVGCVSNGGFGKVGMGGHMGLCRQPGSKFVLGASKASEALSPAGEHV